MKSDMTSASIRKLQREAASCTEELLDISQDIGNEVLPLYTGKDRSMFELQCRLQLMRLKKVTGRMEEIRDALEQALRKIPAQAAPAAGETAFVFPDASSAGNEAADEECRASAQITLQLIAQNLAAAQQKCLMLQELLIGSAQAGSDLKAAKKLQDAAQAEQLRNALQRMRAQDPDGYKS